jgi:hypothetical protein
VIGLKLGVAARTDMVQHENGTDAFEYRPQQNMCTGEIKRSQPGADDMIAKLFHRKYRPVASDSETNGRALNKLLAKLSPLPDWAPVFAV